MRYLIHAACGCHTGNIRKNNEDNYYFAGKCLEMKNNGLKEPLLFQNRLKHNLCFAVFDGMGGENYGEYASFAAAQHMVISKKPLSAIFTSDEIYLEQLSNQLNEAVVQLQEKMYTERMGTTMVILYFSRRYVYTCNMGDSRAYLLRNGELLQMTVDHIEKRPGRANKKAPLTQYLGFRSDEIQIDPHIAKSNIKKGDVYLLCSDGLTDMLTDSEILDIMIHYADVESCIQALIQSAIEHGGRDNITAVVCKLI